MGHVIVRFHYMSLHCLAAVHIAFWVSHGIGMVQMNITSQSLDVQDNRLIIPCIWRPIPTAYIRPI
jgi:hypothetical protein